MGFDLTGFGAVADLASKVLDKCFPDKDAADKAKLALFQMQQQGEFKQLEMDYNLALEQIKVNAIQAANPSLFVSGGRPAIMWVCVTAYAFNYLLMPLANWIVKFWIADAPVIVALDTGELTTLLFGMLGISGMRMVEKIKGVAK